MNLTLTRDEASLVRYACNDLANKRLEQAIDGRASNPEWARANEREARELRAIAGRISELERTPSTRTPYVQGEAVREESE